MSTPTFRTLINAIIDAALNSGWHLTEVQGELVVASMSLDERIPETMFHDEPPY